ncbi:hypothetical protein NW752_006235 [Fusarium irregulare]|uniref:Protein kinase domain-containing protein n=1 Tax=Fusarium irregulare TaxID=2494466 RepID=A0A9W8U9V1_9HYPO|nr:hypothetical protein NW766_006778 [Fusarium irregulare]KAJ4017155.1 hypothetical protein NW752_006235 [Fusarium irregulare]
MDAEHSTNLKTQAGQPQSHADADEEPVFEFLGKPDENIWIVTRRGDPRKEQYLASPSNPYGVFPDGSVYGDPAQSRRNVEAQRSLMSKHNQAYTVRNILNHENLLSIVGIMQYQVFTQCQAPEAEQDNVELLVWDFADAGNLSNLFRHYPVEDSSHYLPESLCWHVLRSMTRAVTWLHEGKRLVYQHEGDDPEDGFKQDWLTINTDWFSILHRAIEPKNIWFQHPRGTETYGQCKLGDLSKAAVTCHAVDGRNENKSNYPPKGSFGIALATKEGDKPLENTRQVLDSNVGIAAMDEGDCPYTVRDEIWSIGATVFTMMTGQAPSYCCERCGCSHIRFCKSDGCLERQAAAKGCDCLLGGCEHIPEGAKCHDSISHWPDCPPQHNCPEVSINIHSWLAQARYSTMLRTVIMELLSYDPNGPNAYNSRIFRMWQFADAIEEAYKEWKTETEDGRDYVDIEDDMARRLQVKPE